MTPVVEWYVLFDIVTCETCRIDTWDSLSD